MCGIAGIFHYRGSGPVDQAQLKKMADSMVHRGPDDEGFFVSGPVGFAHRRLSIIDLKSGHQPMSNLDDSVWIVFNGEIFNHLELRANLERKGYRYKTSSDTETIIHAYEEYGDSCVEHFRGMFSFALWDGKLRKLFVARDRLGIKPLYYINSECGFAFASEIKALIAAQLFRRAINEAAIAEFFILGYLAGNDTMFQDVLKLPPGHVLTIQNGVLEIRQYWDLPLDAAVYDESEDKIIRQFNDLFEESVRLRLVSDVPLGAFLSGGVDSAGIVAMATKLQGEGIKTFSIGFDSDGSIDERKYARCIAEKFRTDHHEIMLVQQDFWDLLKSYVWHMDEPISDAPSIALMLMSREARHRCTVLLSGEGADELFAGYSIYRWMSLTESIRHWTGLYLSDSLVRMPKLGRRMGQRLWAPLRYKYWGVKARTMNVVSGGILSEEFCRDAIKWDIPPAIRAAYEKVEKRGVLDQMLYMDLKTWLPNNLLTRADKMTMAASIELRVPFLDHKLVEYAFCIPETLKINRGVSKYIEKRAFAAVLPSEIVDRPKVGFQTPIGHWLKGNWITGVAKLLLEDKTFNGPNFDRKAIRRIVDEHVSGKRDHTDLIWSLVVFAEWCQIYLEGSPSRTA